MIVPLDNGYWRRLGEKAAEHFGIALPEGWHREIEDFTPPATSDFELARIDHLENILTRARDAAQ